MCDNKSSSHARAVKGYLKPKTHSLFEGFVAANEVSESTALNMIVKDFFSRLPENQKVDYLSRARTKHSFS